MVFGFGKHNTQDDLDKDYYKRRAIYLEAKEKERENMARQRGFEDARAIANKKPFYQKVIGVGMAIGRDLTNVNPNPDALFSWGTPQQPKRKRRRKRSRAR
jgi:hypothetical protein